MTLGRVIEPAALELAARCTPGKEDAAESNGSALDGGGSTGSSPPQHPAASVQEHPKAWPLQLQHNGSVGAGSTAGVPMDEARPSPAGGRTSVQRGKPLARPRQPQATFHDISKRWAKASQPSRGIGLVVVLLLALTACLITMLGLGTWAVVSISAGAACRWRELAADGAAERAAALSQSIAAAAAPLLGLAGRVPSIAPAARNGTWDSAAEAAVTQAAARSLALPQAAAVAYVAVAPAGTVRAVVRGQGAAAEGAAAECSAGQTLLDAAAPLSSAAVAAAAASGVQDRAVLSCLGSSNASSPRCFLVMAIGWDSSVYGAARDNTTTDTSWGLLVAQLSWQVLAEAARLQQMCRADRYSLRLTLPLAASARMQGPEVLTCGGKLGRKSVSHSFSPAGSVGDPWLLELSTQRGDWVPAWRACLLAGMIASIVLCLALALLPVWLLLRWAMQVAPEPRAKGECGTGSCKDFGAVDVVLPNQQQQQQQQQAEGAVAADPSVNGRKQRRRSTVLETLVQPFRLTPTEALPPSNTYRPFQSAPGVPSTPADLIFHMSSEMLEGRMPCSDDVMYIQSCILECVDVYRPTQMDLLRDVDEHYGQDDDVLITLMRQLGGQAPVNLTGEPLQEYVSMVQGTSSARNSRRPASIDDDATYSELTSALENIMAMSLLDNAHSHGAVFSSGGARHYADGVGDTSDDSAYAMNGTRTQQKSGNGGREGDAGSGASHARFASPHHATFNTSLGGRRQAAAALLQSAATAVLALQSAKTAPLLESTAAAAEAADQPPPVRPTAVESSLSHGSQQYSVRASMTGSVGSTSGGPMGGGGSGGGILVSSSGVAATPSGRRISQAMQTSDIDALSRSKTQQRLDAPSVPAARFDVVEAMLQSAASSWTFDTMALAAATGNKPLSMLAFFLIDTSGLASHFNQ